MLFDRTLVLDPTETVEIEVAGHRQAGLAVDGQLVATLGARRRRALPAGRRDGELRAPRRAPLPPDPARRSSASPTADRSRLTMLTELHIENLGVIERLDLASGRG